MTLLSNSKTWFFSNRSNLELGLKSASTLLAILLIPPIFSHLGCAGPAVRQPSAALPTPPIGMSAQEKARWWEENFSLATSLGRETEARQALGEAYLKCGRYELARTHLRKALYGLYDPAARMAAQRQVGESYYREGDLKNAETELRNALNEPYRGPEKEHSQLLLSVILEKQGKEKEAKPLRDEIGSSGLSRLSGLEREYREGIKLPSPETSTKPVASLRILPRNLWKPAPTRSNYEPMGKVTKITIHHSENLFTQTDAESSKDMIRRIQKFHQENDGWADIGYHYMLDRAGNLWEARPEWMQGAHAGNGKANEGNLGICLLGNYNEQSVTAAQEKTLRAFLEFYTAKYSIPATRIYTHQEIRSVYRLAATECPGNNLQSLVERIRRNFYSLAGGRGALLQTSSSKSR